MRTLDDLVAELNKMGYILSRTGVYLRLMPRRQNSLEGKRHVKTVPVRLWTVSNDKCSKNPDRWFVAQSCLHYAEEHEVFFGPKLAYFVGQEDKAHVPIGITAANKQAPLLMDVKYKV